MTASIICALLIVAASGLVAFFANRWFWSTNYSKTNKRGDGGGPFGGVWVMASGVMTGLLLSIYVGKYFLLPSHFLPTFIASCVVGLGAAIYPMFRRPRG